MADNKTIDQLTEVTTLADTKNLIVGSNSTANRITWSNIKTLLATVLQPLSAGLTSLATLATAADKIAYTTAEDVWAEADITAFGRSLIDDEDAATAITTLGAAASSHTHGLADITDEGALAALDTVGTTEIDDDAVTLAKLAHGTAGKVIGFDGSGVPAEVDGGSGATGLPRGHISGLVCFNNGTDPTNDIDIAEGKARSDDDTDDIALTGALTKQLDAAWALGDDAGGLDTGTVSDTTYHTHLIKRSDTGVVDALFSLSPTAPTLPANYDLSRRVGSFMRIGGVNLPFAQVGDEFLRSIPISSVDITTNPGTSAVLATLHVPTGVQMHALFSSMVFAAAPDTFLLFTSPDQTDTVPSATVVSIGHQVSGTQKSGQFRIRTNTSAQIRYRFSQSDINVGIKITTHGWIDRRGRDD
jgi:hypothetical protein